MTIAEGTRGQREEAVGGLRAPGGGRGHSEWGSEGPGQQRPLPSDPSSTLVDLGTPGVTVPAARTHRSHLRFFHSVPAARGECGRVWGKIMPLSGGNLPFTGGDAEAMCGSVPRHLWDSLFPSTTHAAAVT